MLFWAFLALEAWVWFEVARIEYGAWKRRKEWGR